MQPKLVRKGTAAAVAETAAAALAEHEAARRVDLKMASGAFDKALEPDPLAEGRAKGAAAGDPLREGMINLSAADAAWLAELGLSLGSSPAQGGAPEQHSMFLDVHDGDSTPPPPPEDDVPEPPVFEVVAAAAAKNGASSTCSRPRISPTCQKSPAAARDPWTART